MSTEPLLLTIEGAAKALSCSTRLVEKLIASGELPSLRLGKRARRLTHADLIDYIGRLRGDQAEPELEPPQRIRMNSAKRKKEAKHAAPPARVA